MSNVKRKDSKNRNLRNGESQRKDGRYVYKYTDIYGKPQFIYSWKLVPTDKTPAGKRDDISLREKTEDTFINIPIYTESHNLSILGNLYRQTRHLLESVMIYR